MRSMKKNYTQAELAEKILVEYGSFLREGGYGRCETSPYDKVVEVRDTLNENGRIASLDAGKLAGWILSL